MQTTNVKYDGSLTETNMHAIRIAVKTMLEDKKEEIDKISEILSVSDCLHTTAIQNMLTKDKELVNAFVSFYIQLLNMLDNASESIENTENAFSFSHLRE